MKIKYLKTTTGEAGIRLLEEEVQQLVAIGWLPLGGPIVTRMSTYADVGVVMQALYLTNALDRPNAQVEQMLARQGN